MNTHSALKAAIAALNSIPNSGLPDNDKGERMNTYKLIPQLEAALLAGDEHRAFVKRIAEFRQDGEVVEDDGEVYHFELEADDCIDCVRDLIDDARALIAKEVHHV